MTSIREMFGDFDGVDSSYNPLSFPKTALKVNHAFEKAGIKKITSSGHFQEDTCFEDLTLMIYPTVQSHPKKVVIISRGGTNGNLYGCFEKMKGFVNYTSSYTIPTDKDKKKILVDVGTGTAKVKDYEMGCYFKERNIIIIYLPIFCSNLRMNTDNEFLFFFVDNLVNWMKKHKVKKSDNTKFMEKKMIEKFCESSKRKISENEARINSMREYIEQRARDDVRDYKEIVVDEKLIETLEALLKNADKEIEKQIREVKSLKFVKSVKLTMEGLKIDVGEIKIRYNKKEIYIGDFVIYLSPLSIKIENKKRLPHTSSSFKKGLIHPHIHYSDEVNCYGSARRDEINKLLAKNEFKKLTYLLYLFLKSYNSNDSYYSISYWTILNKKGVSIFGTAEGEREQTRREEGEETFPTYIPTST